MAAKGFIELLRLADLAQARKTGRFDSQKTQWTGVVFELSGNRFVAPMGEVNEVLSIPDFTPIPLVDSWILGVANVRGRLLPLTDLSKFLRLETSPIRLSQKKILVIDHEPYYMGLIVDQVMGIQSFTRAQYRSEGLPIESPFARFNHGKFLKDEQEWRVFMPSLLVQDERFIGATAVHR